MKKVLIVLGAIVALILIFGLIAGSWVSNTQVTLVNKSQAVDGQWSQVENVYQRRADLIPNLVNSVKGGMAQEKEVFGEIAEARTKYGEARTTDEKVAAANELDSAISRLLVIMENYPQLKSIDTVNSLMTELAGTENRIAVERRRYNEVAQDYNSYVKRWYIGILAKGWGFGEKAYFEAEPGAEKPPVVDFGK